MNSVITKTAREKVMKARAEGLVIPKIVGVAFGKGGVTPSGEVIQPDEEQTTLNSELLRKEIDGYEYVSDLVCRYTCTLTSSELAGEDISEMALYDEEDDLVAIKNFTAKGKDSDLEMGFQIDDSFENEVI